MNYVFAPGCALYIYKRDLSDKIHEFLCTNISEMDLLLTCCRDNHNLSGETKIINICPGCNKRYKSGAEEISTLTLWELIADSNSFNFPDYEGMKMTVLDACPTRAEENVHAAIRKILKRMNINVIEAEYTMTRQKCCGDSLYPSLPVEVVNKKMKERASEMPIENVCVYCVSCIKSIFIGGKTPRYLVDLLFNETTSPGTYETDKWHAELEAFREHVVHRNM